MFGHNFTAEGDDLTPQISVTPASGVTLQVSYVSDDQINMSYSVASNASPGAYGVRVTTYAGSSNVSNIMVGDPTPVITSVIPIRGAPEPSRRSQLRVPGSARIQR
jgi:hypothetical protein